MTSRGVVLTTRGVITSRGPVTVLLRPVVLYKCHGVNVVYVNTYFPPVQKPRPL